MKRITALLLLCVLALSGCKSGERQPDTANAAVRPSPVEGADSELRAYYVGSEYIPIGYGENYCFERDCNSMGRYSFERAGSFDTGSGGYMTRYTDFASATKYPLCFKDGCAHEDENCDARKTFYDGFATDERFIGIKRWASSGESAEIQVYSLDGSERETIYSLDAPEDRHYVMGCILEQFFYDGENVYFFTLLQESADVGTVRLLKVNIDTKEQTELLSWESLRPSFFAAAVKGEDILFVNSEYSSWQGVSATAYRVSTSTGELETADFDIERYNFFGADLPDIEGDPVFVLRESNALVAVDLMTGEEREVLKFNETIGDYRLLDGRWIINYTAYIEPESGLVKPLTQTFLTEYFQRPITVCGETGDEFLVITNGSLETKNRISFDGVPYSEEVLVYDLALIAKDDYWNNIPNYREITEVG